MLVAVDQDMSDLMLDLAGEFGIDFDRKRGRVVDHFSYEPSLDRGWVSSGSGPVKLGVSDMVRCC